MKAVKGVVETRSWLAQYVTMSDNSIKSSRIKILKPYAHLHITGRKSTKFQVNPMKDVGVAETRSLGREDGRKNGITHTRTDDLVVWLFLGLTAL